MGIGIVDGVETQVSLETLARMSLEALLYYVLVGSGMVVKARVQS